MRPDIFLATIGRGSNGSNALEVTEDRAAVTAESQDNIINRVNNVSQYGPSWHYVPGIGVAGTAYAEVPGTALGDLAFTRASSKTRTNAAGVVETIGNNVPPHDYRNADGTLSTFPRLNLEPQRTNLLTWSEDLSNAAWTKIASSILSNVTTAPTGTLTADKLVEDSANTSHTLFQSVSISTSTNYVYSVYLKAAERFRFRIRFTGFSGAQDASVNLNTQTTTLGTLTSAGNGWFRFAWSVNSGTGFSSTLVAITLQDESGNSNYLGNGTSGAFIWGAQLEAGAYPTTYIPTTTAAVTRIADIATKSGVSSLIGQSAGAMFAEINLTNLSLPKAIFGTSDGTLSNRIILSFATSTSFTLTVRNGGTNLDFGVTIPTIPTTGGLYKVAIAYAANNYAVAINGTLYTVTSPASVSATNSILVGQNGGGANIPLDGINQAALFLTRLPNATLAQMTTL
jgi:hypothetical protein